MNQSIGSNATAHGASEKAGRIARAIEKRAAKVPPDVFLWGAGAALVGSAVFQAMGARGGFSRMRARGFMRMGPRVTSLFVGQWVPTLLLLGLYNKIVKAAGSDRAAHD